MTALLEFVKDESEISVDWINLVVDSILFYEF